MLLSLSSWGQNKNEQVLPQALSSSSTEMKTSDKHPLEMMKGKIEDISKRTADAKHFKNKDGSYTALIGAGAMHYQKNGKWEDIDTKIKKNNSQDFLYANTSNLMESHFGASSNKGIISKTKEGEVKEFLNGKMYWEANGNAVNTQEAANVKATIDGDKIYYHNLFGKISAEYIVNVGQRKLNYIIPSKADLGNVPAGAEYLVFEEEIVLPKSWSHKFTENGIVIQDSNGKEIYLYEKPYSTDAANELTRDKNTIFETSSTGNTLTIKTKVKTSWLLNNERVFPVMVDPTVNANANASVSVYNDGDVETVGYFGLVSNFWLQYHIKFNTSTVPVGSNVTAVTGYIYQYGMAGTRNALSQWLWRNSSDPATTSGITLYNSATVNHSSAINTQTTNGWKNIPFNATGITYVSNGINSTGFVSSAVRASGTFNNNNYYGNRTHADTDKPYLAITYTVPSGPPSCITNMRPQNGATGVAHQGNLAWNAVASATSYDVYLGTSATPPLVASNLTTTTYTITDCLLPNTKYYWKVVPKNADGSPTTCPTWSFTTDGKLNIYQNNWELENDGVFNTAGGVDTDGWLTNNNTATGGVWSSGYNNTWTVGTGTHAINGKSVGISALQNGALAGNFFQYWSDLGELHRWIYRPFDMRGLRDIEVSFKWKAGGEANQDYGSVISSINGGANWSMNTEGGLNNDGKYWNSPTTIQNQTIIFPETRNNQQNFVLGFKWDDLSGNGNSSDPSFVIDDIFVKACPYEGNILSDKVGTGVYEWIPTGSTQTTLSINGSHSCAQYEWEQSVDNGVTWTVISGATTSSYTTPSNITINTWYRSKVYFGTGCPGVYQEQPFKIIFPVAKPENITFYNYGGTEQLAFNNSRIDTNTPKFRLSHQAEEANEYQIEINTNPTFSGGTNWVQNFTGTFNTNTENNFTITNAFSPSNNTTYYVRARAKASVNNEWSDWTTETYSFTYQTPKTNPDWFQTTQAQFQSNSLSGVIADASHDVITASGGNRVVNGDFSNGTTGWTVTKSISSATAAVVGANNGCTNCSPNPNNFKMGYPWATSNIFTSDYVVIAQSIDLTGVSEIKFNIGRFRSFGGIGTSTNSATYFRIGGTVSNETGANLYTSNLNADGSFNDGTITINTSAYTGVQVIKFVFKTLGNWDSNTTAFSYISKVEAIAPPSSTITSTPIALSSVQGVTKFEKLKWNQTLGGGTMTLKLQQTTLGGSSWTDIAGYTNISATTDGEQEFDLSSMTAYDQIRVIATLDGTNVKLHDWSVIYEESCDKTWTGASSSDWHTAGNWLPIGIPTNKNCVNIPNTLNKPVVSSLATAFAQSLELQEFANLKILSGASISIKNEITNHGDESNFVIEDTGSLVQEENLNNTGTITYNRNTAQAWAKDFIYLGSPVSNAQFSQISNEPGKNFGAFYHWLSSPTPGEAGKWSPAIAGNSVNTMTAAQGYIARVPNNWTAATIYKMNFKGIPNNGDITIPFKTGTRQDVVSTSDVNEAYQDKWVLLANPYPSAIDALEMLNLQSNKDLLFDSGNPSNPYNSDGALYFWNHKDGTGAMQNPFYNNGTNYSSDPSNHYIVKNFTGTTPIETPINNSPSGNWNGKIPAAQAFFIRGKENADGHFSFTNSMRATGENDSYYKNNEKHRFWLDLTKKDNNKSAQTLIGYVDGASNGLDFMYDGLSMDNDLDIYTNIMGKNLSIQGRSLPFDSQDIVTLGYTAPQTGAYRIGLFQTEGLFAPHGIQTIYLKDKSNGIIHNLIDAPYEFVTDTGRYNDRFEIVYEKATLTTENIQKTQLNIIYDDLQKRWLILSPQHKISKIEIYDLSGKLIWIKKAINTTALSIPYRHVNQKTALIKVHTDNVEVVTKKIINP